MDYLLLKHLHVTLVAMSVTGFVLRWTGRLVQADWAASRAARTVPHVLDSVLLLSGLGLAAAWGPALGAWFVAKMLGLVAYVVLGALSLRPTRSPRARVAAGLLALVAVAWMVSVALTKQPLGAWVVLRAWA